MILHTVRIPYKDGQVFQLKPCFDWHLGRNCDVKALRRYMRQGIDNPDCYTVGGGDLADSIVTTDKRYTKAGDDTTSGAIIDEQTQAVVDMFKGYEGRVLGIGVGNHELTVLNKAGVHISRNIARMLDTASLGYQWAVNLRFYHTNKAGKDNGKTRTLVIFGHHGWGGGSRTEGGSITKYSNHLLRYEGDIFLYGHDHQLKENRVEYMGIRGKKFIPKNKRLYMCGTFQRTFSKTDEPTWAETKGFNPVTLTGLNIYIKPTGEWFDVWSDL